MNNTSHSSFFFILGRERSGTTLLRNLLNQNKNIGIPQESPLIMHLYGKYRNKSNINIPGLVDDLYTEVLFNLWDIDKNKLIEKLTAIEITSFQQFCLEVLKIDHSEKLLIGDKNPVYSIFPYELHNIFPNAKFVWIIRDYRAQVASMLKVNFEKKNIASLSIRWKNYNRIIEQFYKNNPNQVCLIKYEDLVENPVKAIKNITDFLGTPYEDIDVLNVANNDHNQVSLHHESLKNSVSDSHINEWKEALTKKEIQLCESICGDFGNKYGYQVTESKISTLPYLWSIFYGWMYIPFIKLMYSLPLSLRNWINRKIIYRSFKYWKEAKKELNNP